MESGVRFSFDAVLFDFDGVIGRTMEDNFLAWRHALAEIEIALDEEAFLLSEGRRANDFVRDLLAKLGRSTELAEGLVAKKNDYYSKNNRFSFYDGVDEIVGRLQLRGVKVGLVSGGSRHRLFSSKTTDFLKSLDVVITGDDCTEGKPAPEPYMRAAQILNVAPERCLVIENAPLGIEAAKSAGMKCIAICSTLQRHHLVDADLIVEALVELKKILG